MNYSPTAPTLRQFADDLGISPVTLRRLVHRHRLPHAVVGAKTWVFEPSDQKAVREALKPRRVAVAPFSASPVVPVPSPISEQQTKI